MLNLEDINSLDYDAFVDHFSNIVEYCPFIAGTMWKLQPFKSVDHFVLEAMKTVYSLPIPSKWLYLQGVIRLGMDHWSTGQKSCSKNFKTPFFSRYHKFLPWETQIYLKPHQKLFQISFSTNLVARVMPSSMQKLWALLAIICVEKKIEKNFGEFLDLFELPHGGNFWYL